VRKRYYKRQELEAMTTYRLREICKAEVLAKQSLMELDKDEMVALILAYRGVEEPPLIMEHSPKGWARLEQRLAEGVKLTESRDAKAPSKITLFSGIDLTETDGCRITGKNLPAPGIVLLVSGAGELCAVLGARRDRDGQLSLVGCGGIPARESDRRGYSLWCMDEDATGEIYGLWRGMPAGEGEERTVERSGSKTVGENEASGNGLAARGARPLTAVAFPLLDFSVRQPLEALTPLAIDFGTSNTTAGIYLDMELFRQMEKRGCAREELKCDDANPVWVLDPDGERTPLIPTAVGALSVEGQVRYVFGHEAINLATSAYNEKGFTVFLDIKRWIAAPERLEEVIDKNGFRKQIPRGEIISAYIRHIIQLARQYFKCAFKSIHISAPVKQRRRFQEFFVKALPEYETLESIDEGAAVLYHTIDGLIRRGNYEEGQEQEALIIDCGGGTTDLSSCRFSIENRRVGYHIAMSTIYENGDVTFGGNKLTYRLLQ
jgi:hypothetical protein